MTIYAITCAIDGHRDIVEASHVSAASEAIVSAVGPQQDHALGSFLDEVAALNEYCERYVC